MPRRKKNRIKNKQQINHKPKYLGNPYIVVIPYTNNWAEGEGYMSAEQLAQESCQRLANKKKLINPKIGASKRDSYKIYNLDEISKTEVKKKLNDLNHSQFTLFVVAHGDLFEIGDYSATEFAESLQYFIEQNPGLKKVKLAACYTGAKFKAEDIPQFEKYRKEKQLAFTQSKAQIFSESISKFSSDIQVDGYLGQLAENETVEQQKKTKKTKKTKRSGKKQDSKNLLTIYQARVYKKPRDKTSDAIPASQARVRFVDGKILEEPVDSKGYEYNLKGPEESKTLTIHY